MQVDLDSEEILGILERIAGDPEAPRCNEEAGFEICRLCTAQDKLLAALDGAGVQVPPELRPRS